MKPTESFERELEQALANPSIDPDQSDLARITACLRQTACQASRSPQHQQWAWTRLEAAGATAPSWRDHLSLRWFATGTVAALCLGLIALQMVPGKSSAEQAPSATVLVKGEKLHAVPFHSERANADVIWVDGYDYLPASYPLR